MQLLPLRSQLRSRLLFGKAIWLLLAATCWSGGAYADTSPIDPALPAYQPRPVAPSRDARYVLPDGAIRIVGADHARFILERFNALFSQTHSGVQFNLDGLKGTTTGMPALTHDTTPFAPMGRGVNRVERVPYKKIVGREPLEIRIAHTATDSSKHLATALAIYVNKANPLAQLTTDQVKRIFTAGSPGGNLTRWGQLGLSGEWANRLIRPYGTPEYTGFGSYMGQKHFDNQAYNVNYEQYGNTGAILKRLSADPAGIAFAAIGKESADVQQIAIADREGGVYSKGSLEDIRNRRYPYDRFLYFYVRREPNKPIDPFIKEYFRLVFSREGQQIIASQTDGYVPLNAQEAAAELAKLD
ncbi:PstS family phosphate ABC transporter substrate-binding protein [Collimonas silvisoli]|uniref:PstS family phosphate ABC transporter substrate-binding protein n=1 Tax=Collimonas silvisoli TaxID=2825884 RepID=UPI001B8B00A9|nr:substrate-binding domain-containing protein [Collimonas silvisoli]